MLFTSQTVLETCCVFRSSIRLSVSISIPSPSWQTPAPLPWPEQTWHIHFHGFGWPAASPLYYLFLGVCSTFVPETLPGRSVLWRVERHIRWAKTAGKLHMKCLAFFAWSVVSCVAFSYSIIIYSQKCAAPSYFLFHKGEHSLL